MKKLKIYGIHRKEEIIKELKRLGYKDDTTPNSQATCVYADTYGSGSMFYGDGYDNILTPEHVEVTLQQLKDMPTPKKKVKRECWINLYVDGQAGKPHATKMDAVGEMSSHVRVAETKHLEWEGEE